MFLLLLLLLMLAFPNEFRNATSIENYANLLYNFFNCISPILRGSKKCFNLTFAIVV